MLLPDILTLTCEKGTIITMEVIIGTQCTAETTVDATNIASAVGSGLVDVFATPMMIALLEQAASECLKPFLEDGQASVGTRVDINHTGATPMGMKVFATAVIISADRRKVDFSITVRDEKGEIGSGSHTRFIIDVEKFMKKALSKRSQ